MINGIINVYKEKGFTSHDVVAKLRGILHQKKIGHTGTLDPDAVGVLPVCLGNGTRLCDLLTDTDKEYEATMLLGMTTDTQDSSGELLSECAAELPRERIWEAILSFAGAYDQIPPMYSAIKIQGKKLYELAREGRQVERPARRVMIHAIEILSFKYISGPEMLADREALQREDTRAAGIPFKTLPVLFPKLAVTLRVRCSKGTYIRTLCEDIGKKLGVGAAMCALTRIRSGSFTLDGARTLEQIARSVADHSFEALVCPVDAMFSSLPRVFVTEPGSRLLHNGNPLPVNVIRDGWDSLCADGEGGEPGDGARVRVYDSGGGFTAIYCYQQKSRTFKVVKMFL